MQVKLLTNYMTLGKSLDFPLPFGPPPSWALHRNSLKTRCYIKANISWRPALLTSLKSTKFRSSMQITLLRLNSLISGPDDNQRQTDGRLMNVIGRKASLNIGFVWKVCFFLQVILMIMLEYWHLFLEYNLVEPHRHVEQDQSFGEPTKGFSKSNNQNYAAKMEIKSFRRKHIVIESQSVYIKESEISSIPSFLETWHVKPNLHHCQNRECLFLLQKIIIGCFVTHRTLMCLKQDLFGFLFFFPPVNMPSSLLSKNSVSGHISIPSIKRKELQTTS